ncbi:hypothetical protein HYFRA_00008296 [Hymenoscyphus fraxineus]|uniref:Stress-response A/B barrel domain-containing protein n=1 Tax=Hymenoscyphus fraxineus TaxID=746836 RepID=A0A9N9KMJ9_9HELO|nr:hypothetical protein HYFRA_00008296 [Hymenoscyphus fraxineus]
MPIRRLTLFKIPSSHIPSLQEGYKTLSSTAIKDNKPYIQSLQTYPAKPDQRSQGYTVVAILEFASLEDMKYYDEECEAHKVLKGKAGGLGLEGPPLSVYFEV